MKSTKYQLLKADFESAVKELRIANNLIGKLRKEKEQSYYDGYKQGRFDEQMNRFNDSQ